MTRHDTHTLPVPQGRGTATMILIGGLLLILVAAFLATQSGGVLQHMAPLVWWSILGFLALMGVVMLWGGSFLLRTIGAMQRQIQENASAFMESAQGSFRGSGLSLQSFNDSSQEDSPPIGVASLRPMPFEGADPQADVPLQFTDSQLSADRGFRSSEPAQLTPAATPLPAAPAAPSAAWEATRAGEPPEPAAVHRPSGNFAEPTTASQFGSLPTAPAAFVARPAPAAFGQTQDPQGDAAEDFWIPALQQLDGPRYAQLIDRLFSQAGFVTQPQALSTPGLSAIWLFSRSQLGAPVSLVLCEHHSGEGLQPRRLEELRDVMATHRIRRGQFATTAPVSTALQALASTYAINLLDVPHLLNTISKRKPAQQAELWHIVRAD